MKKISEFLLIWIGVPLIIFIFRCIAITYRFKEYDTGYTEKSGKEESYVYGFWHSQMLPTVYNYRNSKLATIISLSKDGNYAAKATEHFGIKVVRGSSSKGGARALVALKKCMDDGYDVAITADGPRGPIGNINNGVIYLSKISGKKIMPAAFYCDKKIRFRSWDRFIFPLPFAKGGFMFGPPIEIPKDLKDEDIEKYRKIVSDSLFALNERIQIEVSGKSEGF